MKYTCLVMLLDFKKTIHVAIKRPCISDDTVSGGNILSIIYIEMTVEVEGEIVITKK